ncbi:DUF3618 domain-containing protein [uncultured Jatrophihabitans sp.]|uniref:DUF3618 domain-containing protein n=1 Tax=uncultured Jatrophihabitans sp. TaxID=1610747 RepID=UPI0035CBD452
MSSPEEIQAQIEQTRNELSGNVDRLADKVSPSAVVGRQVDKVKGRGTALKERVMGSSDDSSGLRGAGDSVGSAAGSAKDAATGAPQKVKQQAQGNPFGVGLVAFGIGLVLGSLAPASEAEQQLAAAAEGKARQLAEPAKQLGQDMAEQLKPAVQGAVEEVRSSAQDAANTTTEQAKSAKEDVQAPLQS